MFYHRDAEGYQTVLPGITRKTLVYGEKTLFTQFHLLRGHILPRHSHMYEQTGYLVSGEMELTIGGESFKAGPGDAWCIPGGMEHGAVVVEDSVAIEVFAPVREDYVPHQECVTQQ